MLPQGLCKIRYYGIMSNRKRKTMLARSRELLGVPPVQENTSAPELQWQEVFLGLTGIDVRVCPECHTGQMIRRRILHPLNTHAP